MRSILLRPRCHSAVVGLLELKEDRAHPRNVFHVLRTLWVEVAQLGNPFPLSSWFNRLKWSGHKCLVLGFPRVPVCCSKSLKLVGILNVPVGQFLGSLKLQLCPRLLLLLVFDPQSLHLLLPPFSNHCWLLLHLPEVESSSSSSPSCSCSRAKKAAAGSRSSKPDELVLLTSPTKVGTMATGSTISPKSSSKPDMLGRMLEK